VGPFLLDQFPSRAAFAADVDQRRLLAHVAREAVAVIAEAGGVADQKPLWIFEQRLESVRIFAPIRPGEDTAVSHHRAWELVLEEKVRQVDAVAHPLVGDAAGKIFVQAELEILPRIERPIRLVQQPLAPVRILLADLFYFRTAAPSGTVIIPYNLDFADVPQYAGSNQIAHGDLVRLT